MKNLVCITNIFYDTNVELLLRAITFNYSEIYFAFDFKPKQKKHLTAKLFLGSIMFRRGSRVSKEH